MVQYTFIKSAKNNLDNSHVHLTNIYLNNSKFGSCQAVRTTMFNSHGKI